VAPVARSVSGFGPSEPAPESSLALSGVLQGDVLPALEELWARAPREETIVLSCARLVRVDYVAAVSILNWVTTMKEKKRSVLFVNVPRLLAAYFDVVGISAQARVLTSKH
jgi:ABC-type transporter Mla MlaB component